MSNLAEPVVQTFLVEEQIITGNGESPSISVSECANSVATLTLGVLESVEQQSLDVAILRSEDGATWDEKPVLVFPQRFYAGTVAMALDLKKHPDSAFLKARWTVNRWGRGPATPYFRAYLFYRV